MKRYIKASIESELEKYENSGKFSLTQMEEIRLGLKHGVDVSIYADPEYDWDRMWQIREGLEKGFDVSWYADPEYDYNQMYEIRKGLEQGVDVSKYANPKYDNSQMREIREKLAKEKPQKPKRVNWKSIVRQLENEAEDGTDSFYELTDAGDYVTSICQEVESKLDIFAEPSIQAGRGSIYFSHDEWGAASMDYQSFNDCVYDMAVESKNVTEFKDRYKGFLEDLDWAELD